MGRKPKIISYIPGDLAKIAYAIFAKDKLIKRKKASSENKKRSTSLQHGR